MKTFTKFLVILAAIVALGLTTSGQKSSLTSRQKPAKYSIPTVSKSDPLYLSGAITVKLKPGTGDFTKQTGNVSFGISTLDEKVAVFRVYQLEKRFKYNPAKLRIDLPDLSRIYKLSFPENFSAEEVAGAFASDPNVEYAEVIPIGHMADVPNDSLFSLLQHLPQIHAPEAWDIHKGENGTEEIIIAINDTGVDWDHVDLRENVWQNMAEDADNDGHTMEFNGISWILDPGDQNGIDDDANGFTDDLVGWNFINSTGDPNPIPGNPVGFHGTHCAGISNGATNNETGIASISWNLTVMPICMDQSNTCVYAWDGIIYAAENGADIISNSWGGFPYSIANQEVVTYATGLGSIFVAAAGNANNSAVFYPADYQNVISVASVSAADTRAPYSNYNFAVDISAPGGGTEGGILSTMPGGTYELLSGTSMATPCVAGCFGLLKSYHPDWSNDQLITQLLGTADNIDSLNPDYINMLGSGRVNTYRMLTEENVMPFLKLELLSFSSNDANNNLVNEPGESFSLNFVIYNHMQCYGQDDVEITLFTDDPEVTITSGTYTTDILPDDSLVIQNQFQVQVAANAHSHYVQLKLHFDTDIPITMGQDMGFDVLVAPSGIFVFEGIENGRDYSGTLITDFLDRLGFEYTYHNTYPPTLMGFETVFLSHGNFGKIWDKGTMFTENHSLMVQDFLESGGSLFIDAGGLFHRIMSANYSNKEEMKQLFGIESTQYSYIQNPIDSLMGAEGTPLEGILFTESNQLFNWHIDKLFPASGAMVPFYENDFGNVSMLMDGTATYGHKTFYLGYSLAELFDRDSESSRYNILLKVMDFFGYDIPQEFLLSNFIADVTVGAPPLEVQFTDISLHDPDNPVTAWQWDFNNDGIIDSYDQNPSWTYIDSTSYDVKLITDNSIKTDTLLIQGLITINYGYLVYEGNTFGYDYSGEFIRDYLAENAYTVSFRKKLPDRLGGLSAVFLSFGMYGSGNTLFDDEMAFILKDYLENGGYVYLEGGDALGYDQTANTQLLNLLGIATAVDGTANNPINNLEGQPFTLAENLIYMGNTQASNAYIDRFLPSTNGLVAFIESNSFYNAVQQSIPNGRRSFCFSYAISKLSDGDYPNTREELLHRILNFFDIYTGEKEMKEIEAGNLLIYPNPGRKSVTITLPVINDVSILSVFNVSGEKVIEKQIRQPETQLDINFLPRGVYFVRVQDEKMVEVVKMIKQ